MIKIIGISGSLRKDSFNSWLLETAKEMAPEAGAEIGIFDIGTFPLFDQDDEMNMPPVVVEFKKKIEESDAVLFVSPEYNYSFSGVIKNAIDWGSRPWGKNSFVGKPAAIMGASSGHLGTARMQYHLRQVLHGAGMFALSRPEVMVAEAQNKFDGSGKLTDENTRKAVLEQLQALIDWTNKIKS